MKNVKYFTEPSLKNPTMIACWSGMGNVGLGAADYIRTKVSARLLAETDITDLVAPESIAVTKGVSSIPKVPNLSVYYSKTPPLIISLGKEQFYGKAGEATMSRLLDIASRFNVKRIFTCAAFPTYMSYRSASLVYAASNSRQLLKALKDKQGLIVMENGQISGLNGLLLESARKRKIEAACLLSTLPIYAVSFPNPKASKAIVQALAKIISAHIDTTELDISVREVDKMLHNIEEQLKNLGVPEQGAQKDEFQPPKTKDELPKHILDRIEKMFEEAKKDKRIAHRLKAELDRWNLFKLYEDRFLDLFRENQ